MQLYYSDHFPLPLPAGHRFPMTKYSLLRNRIADSPDLAECKLVTPAGATNQQLLLVHSERYVEQVVTGDFTPVEQRRIGFPWSELMVERSRRSTGASIEAGRSAIRNGISGNLAGGTHHAFSNSGQGYCVFNDVCVAARVLQSEELIQNALIVDCDVHQGNGSAEIANQDPTLFTFSMHCDKNYPFKKTPSDLDVALPEFTPDGKYLNSLEKSLDEISSVFQPDIVFYLAGADPYTNDRLGKFNISKNGLRQRDQIVFQFFTSRNIPIAFCMAGGYARAVEDIVDIHFGTVCVAWTAFQSQKHRPTR